MYNVDMTTEEKHEQLWVKYREEVTTSTEKQDHLKALLYNERMEKGRQHDASEIRIDDIIENYETEVAEIKSELLQTKQLLKREKQRMLKQIQHLLVSNQTVHNELGESRRFINKYIRPVHNSVGEVQGLV